MTWMVHSLVATISFDESASTAVRLSGGRGGEGGGGRGGRTSIREGSLIRYLE